MHSRKFVSPILMPALTLIIILAVTALSGCTNERVNPEDEIAKNGSEPDNGLDNNQEDEIDYAAMGVNELGRIMVLMYHEIGDTEGEWVRTPDNFRKDLENLYENDYRLVSMNDVLDGNIDIPPGTSPVVLTFDDSTPGQFRFLEQDGELVVDPDCAVGILEQFHKEYPDFGLAATFYMIAVAPFGQNSYVQEKMDYLVERGFEIGNHTYSHGNLRSLSPVGVKKELAYHVKFVNKYLPDYQVRSLALPYGAHPDDMSYIIQGNYEGTPYHNEGILLVGANPAPSPFSTSFKPEGIPRIRASEMNTAGMGIYDWMQRLEENEDRYISDGNPKTVVIPESLKDVVDKGAVGEKELIVY